MVDMSLKVNIEADTRKLDRGLDDALKKPRFLEGIKGVGGDIRAGAVGAITGEKPKGIAQSISKIAVNTAMIGFVWKGIKEVGDLISTVIKLLTDMGGALKGILVQWIQAMKILILPFANFLAVLLRPFTALFMRFAVGLFGALTKFLVTKEKGAIERYLETGKLPWEEERFVSGEEGVSIFDKFRQDFNEWWERFKSNMNEVWTFWKVWAEIGFIAMQNAGEFIWENIILPAWNFLSNVGVWLWEQIIKPAWSFMLKVPKMIWETILLPSWLFLKDVGRWIWEKILRPAWEFLKNIGIWIWDILKSPFDWLADRVRAVAGAINSAIGTITGIARDLWKMFFGRGAQLGTMVTTPQLMRVGEREPEMIVPISKARQELGVGGGGGYSPTINVYATINNEMDIKRLAEKLADYSRDALTRRSSYYYI